MATGDYIPLNVPQANPYIECSALTAVMDGDIGAARDLVSGFLVSELLAFDQQLYDLRELVLTEYRTKLAAHRRGEG